MDSYNFFKGKRVIIVVHTFGHSVAYDLRDFLKEKVELLLLINHPFSFVRKILGESTNSSVTLYKSGVLLSKKKAPTIRGPDLLFWIKDFFLTIFFVLKSREKFDTYVGLDNLNAFTGLFLRRFGRVKKVIFYTIDYVPKRFSNSFFNWIYHRIDKTCCYRSDYLWILDEVMSEAREKRGVLKSKSAPQSGVPIGIYFDKCHRLPFKKINRQQLIYLGGFNRECGIELIIEALPAILKRVPQAKLIIAGAGSNKRELQELTNRLGLNETIKFVGYIKEQDVVRRILASSAIGLATYTPIKDSYKYFAGVTKPITYLAAGLPAIITNVPPFAKKVRENKAGLVINYDKGELAQAIIKLLTDDDFYLECRQNAIRLASSYDFNSIYQKAFKELEQLS